MTQFTNPIKATTPAPDICQISRVSYAGCEISSNATGRVYSLSSSSQIQDHAQLAIYAGKDLARLDNGLQLHFLTRVGDHLVARVDSTDLPAAANLQRGMAVNSSLWKHFLNIELAHGNLSLTVVNESLSPETLETCLSPDGEFFRCGKTVNIAQWNIHRLRDLGVILPALDSRILDWYVCDPIALNIAKSVAILDHKQKAIELATELGILAPETYLVRSVDQLAQIVKHLDLSQRYVIKAIGLGGSLGIFGLESGGLSVSELLDRALKLEADGTLPQPFQLQQFLKGQPIGVVALIGLDQEILSLGVTESTSSYDYLAEKTRPQFAGFQYCESRQEVYSSMAEGVISKILRATYGDTKIQLAGPINFDLIFGQDRRFYLLEINPRYSGSCPLINVRDHLRSSQPDLPVKQIDLDLGVPFRMLHLQGDWLLNTIRSLVSHGQYILPQGINPFGNSSVMFVNDLDGSLRTRFRESLVTR